MRIMYFVPYDIVGGAETQLEYLIKHLRDRCSIKIVYYGTSKDILNWIKKLNVIADKVHSPNDLAKKINEYKPDIFQFYHSELAFKAVMKATHRPKVVEVIHNKHHFSADATTYPKLRTDACVCVSPDAESNFLNTCPYNLETTKVLTIPNGIDSDRFNEKIRKPVPKLGGYTGRLEVNDDKGIKSLIADLCAVTDDFKFQFVGQDYGDWRHVISSTDKLEYNTHTTTPEDYYSKWSFFVSRSPNEGFGLSIAEAISCGIPSVVYDCGGVVKYLKHGVHALIANNDSEMKKYISQILKKKWKPKEIPDFSSKTMSEKYHSLYRSLMLGVDLDIPSIVVSIETLAIVPKSWIGVRESVSSISDMCVDPATAINSITHLKPKKVLFGGFMPEWEPIASAAKKAGCEVVATLQHTPVLHEFNSINGDAVAAMISCYKRGIVDKVLTPHYGLYSTLQTFGIKTEQIMNTVDGSLLPKKTGKVSNNIGIFGTGAPWKNVEAQLIGAALVSKRMNSEVTVHTQNYKFSRLAKELDINVVNHPYTDREKFLKLAATMDIMMSVTLTETFGFMAVESFLMGIPCMYSPMVYSMKEAPKELHDLCRVEAVDDPNEICNKIVSLAPYYRTAVLLGKEYCQRYDSSKT